MQDHSIKHLEGRTLCCPILMMLILCSSCKKISNEFIIEHLRGNGLDNLYTMYVKYTKHAGVYTLKFDKKKKIKKGVFILL